MKCWISCYTSHMGAHRFFFYSVLIFCIHKLPIVRCVFFFILISFSIIFSWINSTSTSYTKSYFFYIHSKCQLIAFFHDICMLELLKTFPWNILLFVVIISFRLGRVFCHYFVKMIFITPTLKLNSLFRSLSLSPFLFHCVYIHINILFEALADQNKRHQINFNEICKKLFSMYRHEIACLNNHCLDYRHMLLIRTTLSKSGSTLLSLRACYTLCRGRERYIYRERGGILQLAMKTKAKNCETNGATHKHMDFNILFWLFWIVVWI